MSFESAIKVKKKDTSVRHTVIKACNNKIEQGENNALFYVQCIRSCLGGKKSFFNHFYCKPAFMEIMVVVFKVCNEVLNLFRYNIWKQLFRR